MIRIDCFSIAGMTPEEYEILYARAGAERRAKADRYRLREDKLRCVAADALLRRAVGRDDFVVERGEYGKPRIKDLPGFHFNISHSGDWVVIAYGGGPVGVDVERIDMNAVKETIARRHFTPDEQTYVFGAAGEGRGVRFFEIWTAKESFLKYLGTGLSRSLESFSVLAGEPGVCFRSLPLAPGYCLALCAEEEKVAVETIKIEQILY